MQSYIKIEGASFDAPDWGVQSISKWSSDEKKYVNFELKDMMTKEMLEAASNKMGTFEITIVFVPDQEE